MKQSTFIICLFIAFLGNAQSSNYRPLLKPGNLWMESTGYGPEYCYYQVWEGCTTRRQYFFQGDTTIQGIIYQKCQRQDFSMSITGPFTLTAPYYYAAVREDTVARKVFIFDTIAQRDTLMYDFSLKQGDSLKIGFYPGGFFSLTIVDTVVILADGRKKWWNDMGQEIVEGVGTINGLFPTWYCFETCSLLDCFWQNGTPVYNHLNWPFSFSTPYCDYVILPTDELPETKHWNIHPNPGPGVFEITGLPEETQVQVFDLNGREISAKIVDSQLDLSSQPAGLYLVRIGNGGEVGWGKVVKE